MVCHKGSYLYYIMGGDLLVLGLLDRMHPSKTSIRLQILSCNIVELACTDFVLMCIFSMISGILLRYDIPKGSIACL